MHLLSFGHNIVCVNSLRGAILAVEVWGVLFVILYPPCRSQVLAGGAAAYACVLTWKFINLYGHLDYCSLPSLI